MWVRSGREKLGFVIVGSVRGRREEVGFVMVGSVKGRREEQMGLATWVEGREAAAWVEGELRSKKKSKKEAKAWEKGEPEINK